MKSHNAAELDACYAVYAAASGVEKNAALSRLVDAMRRSAWAISVRVLGQTLPDVVTDSVSGAVQTLHTFLGKARFSTWFYSVVEIHCKMALMAKLSQPQEISLEQLADELAEVAIDNTNTDNARIDLASFLESLDPTDKRLFELRVEGREWKEVGSEVGLSSEAARCRWQRLMASIEQARRVRAKRTALVADSAKRSDSGRKNNGRSTPKAASKGNQS